MTTATGQETGRAMNEFETKQAAREASGAHPYGRYIEEFEVGAVYKHWLSARARLSWASEDADVRPAHSSPGQIRVLASPPVSAK
jgi:hypothetical protein